MQKTLEKSRLVSYQGCFHRSIVCHKDNCLKDVNVNVQQITFSYDFYNVGEMQNCNGIRPENVC